ncbi:MAG: DNA repair protein RecN [Flavobacteriaceae bacterium]|nr:DNA repair protein RecN [Flavobacteriaceae bacterium]
MLTNLSIKNFALIDSLEVSFTDKFSIITGETGAGKSILLGGLGLILGKRADLSVINDTDKKCIVEAEFDIANYKLEKLFKKSELDYETNTIIRREILPSGKSRAFINDSPVSLQVLKNISEQLIDIHSQHQTGLLTDNSFQFEVIDALANNETNLSKYKKALDAYKKEYRELEDLYELQKTSNESHDYNSFLLNELLDVQLEKLDQEALEEELEQLSNVDTIVQQLSHANQLCSNEEVGALNSLTELKSVLRSIADFSTNYKTLFERVESVHIELEDVFGEIENGQQNVEANPERLIVVTGILNKLQSLFQKHKVALVEELLVIQNELDDKVGIVANLDETIAVKKELVADKETIVVSSANQLHEKRSIAIPKLIKQLEKILTNLGMENAKFEISVTQEADFLTNGNDVLSFLFTANKGGNFNELKKAASGGELSRIMLAIKAILSKYKHLPTIMFDEIDTGVSGDVAHKMGMLMQYMSENMQVFSITHLSQIASKGSSHYKVYKEDVDGKTRSNLKYLSHDERVNEIAEMIGGKELTETALNHAKELLSS